MAIHAHGTQSQCGFIKANSFVKYGKAIVTFRILKHCQFCSTNSYPGKQTACCYEIAGIFIVYRWYSTRSRSPGGRGRSHYATPNAERSLSAGFEPGYPRHISNRVEILCHTLGSEVSANGTSLWWELYISFLIAIHFPLAKFALRLDPVARLVLATKF